MKTEQLIELVILRLPDIDWDENLVRLNISLGFNQIFYDTFRKDISNLDLYAKEYKNISVDYDSTTEKYYSLIPVDSFVQFPDPQEGIRRISGMKSKDIQFVPIRGDAAKIFDGDTALSIGNIIGYSVTNGKIEYHWMKEGVVEVKMDIVRSFEAYDDDDEIHIPSGKDEQLIQLIVNFLLGSTADNLVNDNNVRT